MTELFHVPTMQDIATNVAKLTTVTAVKVGDRDAIAEPLIGRIRNAIYSSTGGTHGGHAPANERSVMNIGAFAVYEDIDGQAAALYVTATDLPRHATPEANLAGWLEEFTAAHDREEVVQAQIGTAHRRIDGWIRRINDCLEPPVTKEIMAPCPRAECGERYWYDAREKVRKSALFAQYRRGQDVEAHCRWCGADWVGEVQLQSLGRAIRNPVEAIA